MKVKSAFFVITMIMLSIIIAGCGNNSASNSSEGSNGKNESGYPNKPLDIIVSYSAGGGTDTGARILKPYLEEELGVTVNIVNKPGGGGWTGWTQLANAEPDGYTIGFINSPNMMTGYLNPAFNRDESLKSFRPLANQVTDPAAIAIRPGDDRFSNIDELIEYAKEHELTATSTGVGSDDHYASLKLNHSFDTKFKPVHNKGSANSRSQVLGGHVDVLFANVGEVFTAHQNDKVKVVAVMGKERSKFLPDVPTLAESGYPNVYSSSARGLAAPSGLSDEKAQILTDALKTAIQNKEHIKEMNKLGLAVDLKTGEEYFDMLKQDEKSVMDLRDLLGW